MGGDEGSEETLAAVGSLAEDALLTNSGNATAQEALDYIDLLNPKVDYNAMKNELIQRILALSGS